MKTLACKNLLNRQAERKMVWLRGRMRGFEVGTIWSRARRGSVGWGWGWGRVNKQHVIWRHPGWERSEEMASRESRVVTNKPKPSATALELAASSAPITSLLLLPQKWREPFGHTTHTDTRLSVASRRSNKHHNNRNVNVTSRYSLLATVDLITISNAFQLSLYKLK